MELNVPSKKQKKSSLEKPVESDFHSNEYAKTLANLKHQIQEAQLKAAVSVNRELLCLYWNI
jgi:hypothetical protein